MEKKILIVEDDKDFSAILEKKFKDEGFVVILAQDGEEGFNVASKEKLNLIISDILMPKSDGVTMVKKLRDSKINTPVLFLTNVKDTDYSKELSDFDFLIKANLRLDDIVKKAKNKIGPV